MPRKPRPPHRAAGFSLVEIMIVIVLIGGILALVTNRVMNSQAQANVRLTGHQVYTNTVPSGYFRGPGMVQTIFAAESHMDVLARELGMDPFDFRLKNIVRRHEGIRHRGVAIDHAEQPLVGDGDDGVDGFSQRLEPDLGLLEPFLAFELERLGHHRDGERAELGGEAGDHGRGTGARAAAEAGGDEHHVGA